jgi:hypothetical protein
MPRESYYKAPAPKRRRRTATAGDAQGPEQGASDDGWGTAPPYGDGDMTLKTRPPVWLWGAVSAVLVLGG